MERYGIAMAMDDGLQQQQQLPRRVERQAFLMGRERGHIHGDQASVVRRTGALDFFWRLFARLAGYITRVRRLFVFKVGKDGSVEVKEDRLPSKSENNVVGGLVEAQCEPALVEILVTSPKATVQETTDQGIPDVDTKMVEICHEDCASKICPMESKDVAESSEPLACVVTDQSSCRQEQLSVACEPVDVILPELHGEDVTANEQQKCHSQEQSGSLQQEQINDGLCTADGEKCHSSEQNGFQDVDAVITNKSDVLLQPLSLVSDDSTENSLEGSSGVESLDLKSSRVLKKRVSIKELNAVVGEQLTKFLHTLERNMVPGKAEHKGAIILATLVAIVVWARNAKHLHESMPRIRGSAINVHIRSRL